VLPAAVLAAAMAIVARFAAAQRPMVNHERSGRDFQPVPGGIAGLRLTRPTRLGDARPLRGVLSMR
jgi:hypothetical protein